MHARPGLLALLEGIPQAQRPKLVRGDCAYGSADLVVEAKKGGRKGKDQVQAELHFIDENEPAKIWEYAAPVCNW